jgi:hypothetical protein
MCASLFFMKINPLTLNLQTSEQIALRQEFDAKWQEVLRHAKNEPPKVVRHEEILPQLNTALADQLRQIRL